MDRPSIFSHGENGHDTISRSPVPQAGRLSVGRVRSQVTNIHCLLQEPVDHFGHIPYEFFSYMLSLKQKDEYATPFGIAARLF